MYIIQTNLYSLLIIFIMLFSLGFQKDIVHKTQRYFFYLLYTTAGLLVMDLISELSNRSTSTFGYFIHPISTFFLFALSGLIGLAWILYVLDYLDVRNIQLKKKMIWYALPAIIMVIFSFISLLGEGIFYIDSLNVYHRGRFFFVHPLILYGYFIAVIVIVLKNAKNIPASDRMPLLFIPIFPAIGGLIQVLVYGVLLTWPSAVLSLLIVYLFVQSKIIAIDPLTSLLNRRAFYHKVNELNKPKTDKAGLAGLMIDINHFKSINDTYGHHTGDAVLIHVGKVFKKVFDSKTPMYRIGGDEFFIIINVKNEQELDKKIAKLTKEMNENQPFDFYVNLSIGKALYDQKRFQDFDSFIIHLDQLMYRHKNETGVITNSTPGR